MLLSSVIAATLSPRTAIFTPDWTRMLSPAAAAHVRYGDPSTVTPSEMSTASDSPTRKSKNVNASSNPVADTFAAKPIASPVPTHWIVSTYSHEYPVIDGNPQVGSSSSSRCTNGLPAPSSPATHKIRPNEASSKSMSTFSGCSPPENVHHRSVPFVGSSSARVQRRILFSPDTESEKIT